MRHDIAATVLIVGLLGSAATGAARGVGVAGAAGQPAPTGAEAPLTRAEILKEGPVALQQNCMKCHGSDKWEGTNRDRDGWAAIVQEMSRQMSLAKMPPMSERTTNIVIEYLALTQPQ